MLIKRINIIQINSLLISLLPFFLILGPAISDISIVIISISGTYLILNYKKFYYFNNEYFKIFFLFWIYLLFCSFISDHKFFSLKSSFFYIRFGIFFVSLWFFIDHNENIFRNITYVFIICFIALFVDSLFQFTFGQNIFGIPVSNISNARISSFFGDELILGSYTSRMLPIILGILFFKNNLRNNLIITFLIAISTIIIFLSGERTALLYLFLTILFIFLLCTKFSKYILPIIIISLVSLILFSIISPKTTNRMLNQTFNQIFPGGENIRLFSTKHEALYKTSINIFKQNIFFGDGPKTFRINCKKEQYYVNNGCSSHPHNIYFQSLAEIGIIGFFAVLSFFVIILFKFIKQFISRFKSKPYMSNAEILFFIAIFISLFPFIPGPNFFTNWINVIYYFPIGFLLHINYKGKKYYA